MGKALRLQNSDLHIRILSWCLWEIKGAELLLVSHTPQYLKLHRRAADAFFAYHATSTGAVSNHINIAAEQACNDMLTKINKTLQAVDSGEASTLIIMIDPRDRWAVIYQNTYNSFI